MDLASCSRPHAGQEPPGGCQALLNSTLTCTCTCTFTCTQPIPHVPQHFHKQLLGTLNAAVHPMCHFCSQSTSIPDSECATALQQTPGRSPSSGQGQFPHAPRLTEGTKVIRQSLLCVQAGHHRRLCLVDLLLFGQRILTATRHGVCAPCAWDVFCAISCTGHP